MAHIIPSLLSDSPPPIMGLPEDEEEEDEFGDFRVAPDHDISYDGGGLSVPTTPVKPAIIDINSNKKEVETKSESSLPKDYQDKRKVSESEPITCPNKLNVENKPLEIPLKINYNSVSHSDNDKDKTEIIQDTFNTIKENNYCNGFNNCGNESPVELENSLPVSMHKPTEYLNSTENTPQEHLDPITLIGDESTIQNYVSKNNDDFIKANDGLQTPPDLKYSVFEIANNEDDCSVKSPDSENTENEFGNTSEPNIEVSSEVEHNTNIEQFNTQTEAKDDYLNDFELTNDEKGKIELEIKDKPFEAYSLDSDTEYNLDAVENFDNIETKREIPLESIIPQTDIQSDDDFGDFETPTKTADTPDDFDDFNSFKTETHGSTKEDYFGNFSANAVSQSADDFSDFKANFDEPQSNPEQDDDFGDFAEFSDYSTPQNVPQSTSTTLPMLEKANVAEKVTEIVKIMFPLEERIEDSTEVHDTTEENPIFINLTDITETNATTYQWNKSASQKILLKSLNIDVRNMMYGPLNPNVPRFAANLSAAPLQPMKSEILTPVPVQNSVATPSFQSSPPEEIPTVEFDWSGAGLVNPLDSNLMISSQKETVPVVAETPPLEPNPIRKISQHLDTESVNSLKLSEFASDEVTNTKVGASPDADDFDDFASYQTAPPISTMSSWTNLRETHISNHSPPDDILKERFSPKYDVEIETNKVEIINDTSSNTQEVIKSVEEDEFSDFCSSTSSVQQPVKPVTLEPLRPQILQPTLATNVSSSAINWPDPGICEDDINNFVLEYSRPKEIPNVISQSSSKTQHQSAKAETKPKPKQASVEDDEWSDFVSVNNLKSPSRTGTPDLPLSVLNLASLAPQVKKPVPLITANGLITTKLPTNGPNAVNYNHPSVVQTSVKNNSYGYENKKNQPSFVTNQFLGHMNHFPNYSGSYSSSSRQSSAASSAKVDDDWSDFVSGQPVSSSNKAQAVPNIITNPGHFMSLEKPNQPKLQKQLFSLPELDFIGSKNIKTTKK